MNMFFFWRLAIRRNVILTWIIASVFILVLTTRRNEYRYEQYQRNTTKETLLPSVQMKWPKPTPRPPLHGFAVPNIVHFIRFGKLNLTFIDAVCILAALTNQKPEKLIIHSDQIPFHGGTYWDIVNKHPMAGVIVIEYLSQPSEIFDQPLDRTNEVYHAGDIARLLVLMRYGGIYLDNDSYIVRSLDKFRYYEFTLGLEEGTMVANQIIVASKDAQFLKVWYDGYRNYRSDWWYNGGVVPTELLIRMPYLVNTVEKGLGERRSIAQMVYLERSDAWKSHYAIHLIIGHQYMIPRNISEIATYPVCFNETNILNYEVNIKDMAMDVWIKEDT